MKKEALDSITKISQYNLDRIAKLKQSGYEPNDYIINQALNLLEQQPGAIHRGEFVKTKLNRTTKISSQTIQRISKFKISGYEPNDFIIGKALNLIEELNEKNK